MAPPSRVLNPLLRERTLSAEQAAELIPEGARVA